jgi:hypothetical protein
MLQDFEGIFIPNVYNRTVVKLWNTTEAYWFTITLLLPSGYLPDWEIIKSMPRTPDEGWLLDENEGMDKILQVWQDYLLQLLAIKLQMQILECKGMNPRLSEKDRKSKCTRLIIPIDTMDKDKGIFGVASEGETDDENGIDEKPAPQKSYPETDASLQSKGQAGRQEGEQG